MQDQATWALLAGLAMAANELSTAEYAFGALDAVDKLQYVLHAKGLVGEDLRAAELAAYRRQPEQAEALLLQVSGCTGHILTLHSSARIACTLLS